MQVPLLGSSNTPPFSVATIAVYDRSYAKLASARQMKQEAEAAAQRALLEAATATAAAALDDSNDLDESDDEYFPGYLI